jgi:hypothetical protein
MTNETNRKIVEAIYDAFAKGDIDTVLEHFADQATWTYMLPDGSLPFAGTFEGKSRIGEWFGLFGSKVETTAFELNRLLDDGDDLVVALGHEDGTIKDTGNAYETDWVHVFHMKDNKVQTFVEHVDVPRVLQSFGIE